MATNPAFAQLPSKSPFSPQMTWKLVHSCEKKRRKWQDQRQTYNVWTRLTCLYALPEVWENGDAGPSNGRKSRIFTPLEVMLSDTQRRQCRIFLKSDLILFCSAEKVPKSFDFHENTIKRFQNEQHERKSQHMSLKYQFVTVRKVVWFIQLWIHLDRL